MGDMSVGVVRDKDLNLEDVESSHTPGGSGEGGSHGDGSGENTRGWCCVSKCHCVKGDLFIINR
jgi:hypothetical protein